MASEDNVRQPDQTQQPTTALKGYRHKRTRNLDIVPHEGQEDPINLDNYNPMNSKLTLKNGLMVEITKDDVSTVLGFPHGTIGIERKKKKRVVSALLSTKFKEKLKAKDGEKLLFSWVD
nr:hypothetical protein Iba_chr13dCG10180 [Ipomoea batatas]